MNEAMKSMRWISLFIFVAFYNGLVTSFEEFASNPALRQNDHKVVCYHAYDNVPFNGTLPQTLNVDLCTHIIMFASGIEDSRVHIDPASAKNYLSVIPLMKKMNPSLKVLCSNGGDFSQVLGSKINRTRFAESAAPLLRQYQFEGLDLDYEFPAYMPHWNWPAQKHNFTLTLKALRAQFEKEAAASSKPRLLLSVAVAGINIIIARSYEVPEIAKYVDFINLMTYDIHYYMPESPFTAYNAPLHPSDKLLDRTIFKDFNTVWAANKWAELGMNKSQIMVGVPFYGHTFILADPAHHGLYSLAKGHGPADEVGYIYICGVISDVNSHVVWDNSSLVPYVYQDSLWISYDDIQSIHYKVKWTLDNQFGGTMVFSLNSDDFSASCDGKTRWPLLKAVNNTVHNYFDNHSRSLEDFISKKDFYS